MRQAGEGAARPLIVGTNGKQRLLDLHTARKHWYEQAPVRINTDQDSPETIASRIVAFALAHGLLSSSSLPQEVMTQQLGTITSQAIVEWCGLRHLPQSLR